MNHIDVPDPTAAAPCGDTALSPAAGPAMRQQATTTSQRVHAWWHAQHPDSGQATAEYALVLLGAAMVALILIGWATGSGAGRVGGLLDRVIDAITGSF